MYIENSKIYTLKKLLLFLLFAPHLYFAQLDKVEPELVGVSLERLNRVSEISKNYVTEGKVPGIVTMIARKGKLIYFEAYGNRGVNSKSKIKQLLSKILKLSDKKDIIPPLHGALLKNEQDVHLFERLAFLARRETRN